MVATAPAATPPPLVALGQPAQLDLAAYRGDTGRFRVLVTRDGAPLDVSAATWDCDIRATEDAPILASMTVTPVVGTTNAVDVTLPTAAASNLTGEGVWDLEMTLAGVVTTLLAGAITVTPDVSRPPMELPEAPEAPLSATTAPEGASPPPAGSGAPLAALAPGATPEGHQGPDVTGPPPTDDQALATPEQLAAGT